MVWCESIKPPGLKDIFELDFIVPQELALALVYVVGEAAKAQSAGMVAG
jgi:hypothetical protein